MHECIESRGPPGGKSVVYFELRRDDILAVPSLETFFDVVIHFSDSTERTHYRVYGTGPAGALERMIRWADYRRISANASYSPRQSK